MKPHHTVLKVALTIILTCLMLAAFCQETAESQNQSQAQPSDPIQITVDYSNSKVWEWSKGVDYARLPISFKVDTVIFKKEDLKINLTHSLIVTEAGCSEEQIDSMLLSRTLSIAFEPTKIELQINGDETTRVVNSVEQVEPAAIHLYKSKSMNCGKDVMYLKVLLSLESESYELDQSELLIKIQPKKDAKKPKAEEDKKSCSKDEKDVYVYDFLMDKKGRYKAEYKESASVNTLKITKYGAVASKTSKTNLKAGSVSPPDNASQNRTIEGEGEASRSDDAGETAETKPDENTEEQKATSSSKDLTSGESDNQGVELGGTLDVELFKAAFVEAYALLEGAPTDEQEGELKTYAEKFLTEINKKKEAETAKEIVDAFNKGLKTAIEEIEAEEAIPAGRLKLISTKIDMYDQKTDEAIGKLHVGRVVVNVNNGLIDQLNIYGKAKMVEKTQQKSAEFLDQSTTYDYQNIKDTVHFYNNEWGMSPKSFMKGQNVLNTTITDSNREKYKVKIFLRELITYDNKDSLPLSQRIRPDHFELDSGRMSHVLKRHILTDYLSAALYSDILGISGDQPNSLFLTDIVFEYPLNSHGKIWKWTPSIDAFLNVARLGNSEQNITASQGLEKGSGDTLQFVNVLDYLQFYSMQMYVGMSIADIELKAVETRIRPYAGYTTFRTLVEFDNENGDRKKSTRLSPAFTGGFKFMTSMLDNQLGVRFDARYMFLTPQKPDGFFYSLKPVSQASEFTKNINTKSTFHLMTFELHTFWRRPNDGNVFAKIRLFDSWETRDAFMQFLVGYSVPLSSIKL